MKAEIIDEKDFIYNSYDLYNQSNEDKVVNLFSSEYEEHTGRVDTYGGFNEGSKPNKFHESKSGYFKKVRLKFKKLEDVLFNKVELNGKPIMLAKHYNIYQFTDNMIDVFIESDINNFELKIPLKSKNNIGVSVYGKDSKLNIVNDISDSEFCVIIENKNGITVEVDVMSLLSQKVVGGVSVDFPINDLILGDNNFNNLKIVSFNSAQVTQKIAQAKKGVDVSNVETDANGQGKGYRVIYVTSYMSAMQMSMNVIDCALNFNLNQEDQFWVTILPNTKVMYYFFSGKVVNNEKSVKCGIYPIKKN
ncbi:MAG: hypothetical protein AABY22_11770 [Nanoarchaeota archaeon]